MGNFLEPDFQLDLPITRAILPRLLSFCYSSSRSVGRENRAQSAHRVGDFRYCRAAKAQDEPLARGRPEIGRREWPQPQILACGSCGYNAVTVSFWQCHSQMQARLGTMHMQDGIEFFPDAVDKDLSALAVHQPHSPDVSGEVSFIDKIREHRLIQMRRAHVHCMANCYKVLDEVGGNDDIAHPQRRKQDLAKRTDVDHPRRMVEALQRCYGFAVVAILAVIVRFGPTPGVEDDAKRSSSLQADIGEMAQRKRRVPCCIARCQQLRLSHRYRREQVRDDIAPH